MIYEIKKAKKIQIIINDGTMTAAAVKKKYGCDEVIGGVLYDLSTYKICWLCRINGITQYNDPEYKAVRGYAWNNGDTDLSITSAGNMTQWDNFIAGVWMVENGKAQEMWPSPDQAAIRGNVAIGHKNGSIMLYCTKDGKEALDPWSLQKKLIADGWSDAIMLDGGGSSQMQTPNGNVISSRPIKTFILFWEAGSTSKIPETKEKCPYAEPTRNIKNGSTGAGASWVQWHLNQFGAKLTVDGIFGSKSVKALKEFQAKYNLKVDGICGPATIAALKTYTAPSAPAPSTSTTPTPSTPPKPISSCPYPEPTSNIKRGMTGNNVRWMQWYLNQHGAELKVDGIFGNGTESALLTFQKMSNLDVDGICGKATRTALKTNKVDVSKQSNDATSSLVEKREKMLDIIESFVGGLYVYGAQGQDASDTIIDWSARCFPSSTTSNRAARMKKYIKTHKGLKVADCSGLFWAAENIVELPLANKDVDDSTAEGLYRSYCDPIPKSELQPLDMVFNTGLTHVGIVGRDGKIYEAAGTDIGIVVNDSIDDRVVPSIYGPNYGCAAQYQKEKWTKFGRLKIYKNVPYEKR